MRFDTVVTNGITVIATDSYAGDSGVMDGRITAIMAGLPAENTGKAINATGKMAMPFGVDGRYAPRPAVR